MKIYQAIIYVLLYGCSTNSQNDELTKEVNERDSIEIVVLNHLLPQIIQTDTLQALRNSRFIIQNENESDIEFQKRKSDSIETYRNKIQTNGFSIYFQDSLFQFPVDYIGLIDSTIVNTPEKIRNQLIESKGKPLPEKLNLNAQILDNRPSIDNNNPGYLGFAGFSRIGFNEDFSVAIVYAYYDPSGSGLGGSGWLIKLSKVNGRWIIAEKIGLWVS